MHGRKRCALIMALASGREDTPHRSLLVERRFRGFSCSGFCVWVRSHTRVAKKRLRGYVYATYRETQGKVASIQVSEGLDM
jgi:hypothetical protein